MHARIALWAVLVALPLLILGLLFWQPALDVRWEDNPAHFWLVLAAALVSGILAFTLLAESPNLVIKSPAYSESIEAGKYGPK